MSLDQHIWLSKKISELLGIYMTEEQHFKIAIAAKKKEELKLFEQQIDRIKIEWHKPGNEFYENFKTTI